MLNNTREKLLAGILATSLGLVAGYELIDRVFVAPTHAVRQQVEAAENRRQNLESDFALVEHAQKNLQQVRSLSLPADPSVASLVYQDWLLTQMKDTGLLDAVVTPGQPIPEENVGHRIPFTIQTTANVRQVGRFLDSFYASSLLHRITFLTINQTGDASSSDRKLVVSLEGLALSNATTKDSLPESHENAGERRSKRDKLEYYFARRDPFRRTVIRPISETLLSDDGTEAAPSEPEIDELETIRLVASIVKHGKPQAWLFDTRTDEEFILSIGDNLDVPDFSARVVNISPDSLTLLAKNAKHTTRLGETIREGVE